MVEYEYSFIVKDMKPYIDYCEKEGYEKIGENSQTRELFTSNNKVLARITKKITENGDKIVLDFKDENDSDEVLKSSRETLPLQITESDREAVNSILDILGYKKIKHLDRKRMVYKKGNVTFEIDEYFAPDVMYVVAIEGEKTAVDETYKIISETINNEVK